MGDLRGRAAVVTGASRGLGAAIARALAQAGATVGLNYHENEVAAASVAADIHAAGGKAVLLQANVSDRDAVGNAVRRFEAESGPVSILVHNAGARLQPAKFTELGWSDFEQHFNVSVGGAVSCCHAVVPGMSERRSGVIIFIASAAAHAVPPPQWSSYVTAKAALLGLMRSLAIELGPLGIRVNAVSPGMVATDLTAFVPDRMKQMIAQQSPLRRLASAEDVGKAVAFLASDAAAYINGVALPVAGGTVMA